MFYSLEEVIIVFLSVLLGIVNLFSSLILQLYLFTLYHPHDWLGRI